jgi:hypothetical protein
MKESPARIRSIMRWPEGHAAKLEQSEWCADGCLPDVCWMHRYLIITFSKINLAEDLVSGDPGRKIQHVGKRVRVWLRH